MISFSLALLLSVVTQPQNEPSLNVNVTGIEQYKGYIMIAVYRPNDSFLSRHAFHGSKFKIERNNKLRCSIKLPYGTYAISLFHDVDGDGDLNTNFLSLPSEPYGFSNNASSTFGPPSFDKAKFSFSQSQESIEISLK